MQEWKATDKITQKMTRNGAVQTNKATGEQTRISKRESEADFSGDAAGNVTGRLWKPGGIRRRSRNGKRRKPPNRQRTLSSGKRPGCNFPRKNAPTRH